MEKSYIIAAANKNFGIGKGGEIPWNVPGDFQFFKSMTYGCTVVVGRKTFENIGMLPGRRFVVLTSDETKEGAGPQKDKMTESDLLSMFTLLNKHLRSV